MFTLFRYLVWLVVALMILLLATISISEYLVHLAVDAPYDEKLVDLARALGSEVRGGDGGLMIRPGFAQLLRSDRRDRVYYALRGSDGQVLAGDSDMPPPTGNLPEAAPLLSDGQIRDEPVRVASLVIAYPPDPEGRLIVQVAETLNKRLMLTETLRAQAVALPQILVLMVAILLIVYGYAFVLRPMQRLKTLIDHRGSGDLTPLDPESAPRDMRPLILSINGLMQRLTASIDAQRRFIADAAHQLRTPLAGLKSQTELALIERDPAEIRRTLERIADGTEHATALANRLLTLARAGSPLLAPPQDVDLRAIAQEAIADHLPQANVRSQDLGFEGPPRGERITVRGDGLLLRELLSNLIDNAVRYTPYGGAITVEVGRTGVGTPALAVTDTGPGIPRDEHEKVFEPFYRGAEAEVAGTGLGLAIVRTIAAAHQASVALSPGPNGRGLRVAILFGTQRTPLAATP